MMALKRLPDDVRSILCASAQINNYKTAVAELVYNSLDAESTSIAIRVHIQENRIQVTDNGYGITKSDFDALGQRYMTSKLIDLSTLKSMPNCYGYRGEFLASIIEISENVKVISKHKDGEETWSKTFVEGKTKQLAKMTIRPSRGTTVEVKGFLYNLNIKKRGIDPVNDLQNIKSFLEQLSLAHNNISLSLRDESKNEIVFKIHKKRDIYQTLSILFQISRTIVQEFQIEKNQYKVKAFIGKTEIESGRQWIYINGRFIQGNSKLHKIINDNFKKVLLFKYKKKLKSKNNRNDEDELFKQNLPFYFLFVTCPYIDYYINSNLRQSQVEFKNWEQMNKIIEKLVKFYIGDIRIKENNTAVKEVTMQKENTKVDDCTEDRIKKIINKILGSNSKKKRVSQLQNGVKGKLVNRKKKNKKKNQDIDGCGQNHIVEENIPVLIYNQNNSADTQNKSKQDFNSVNTHGEHNVFNPKSISNKNDNCIVHVATDTLQENKKITSTAIKSKKRHKNSKIKRKITKNNKPSRNILSVTANNKEKNTKNKKCQVKLNKTNQLKYKNTFLNLFQTLSEADNGAKNRLIVSQKEKYNLRQENKYHRLEENDINHCVSLINIHAKNNCYTNYKKCTIQQKGNKCHNRGTIIKINPFKTTYDLVQTILTSQREERLDQTDNALKVHRTRYPILDYELKSISNNSNKTVINPNLPQVVTISEYTNVDNRQAPETNYYNNLSMNLAIPHLRYSGSEFIRINCRYDDTLSNSMTLKPTQQSLRCKDIFQENSDMLYTQGQMSRYSPNIPTESKLTYESHQYNQNMCDYANTNKGRYVNKVQTTRFITKQSRDNFTTNEKFKSLYKHNFKRKNKSKLIDQSNYNSRYIKHSVDHSYTIEFTKSSLINHNQIQVSNQTDFSLSYLNGDIQAVCEPQMPNFEPISGFSNTYTIPTYSILTDCNKNYIQNQSKYMSTNSNELFITNSIYFSNPKINGSGSANITNRNQNCENQDKLNIVFVSKSQCCDNECMSEVDIQPMEVCETILSTNESNEVNLDFRLTPNSELDISTLNNLNSCKNKPNGKKKNTTYIIKRHENEDVSHHFSNTLTTKDLNIIDDIEANIQVLQNDNDECIENIGNMLFKINNNNFDFKDRLRFLPKGMSQIFDNCGSRVVCDYNIDKDYYNNVIYNDFANDVQRQTDIYEAAILNLEDVTTKDINKFENKVHKDNTTLVFDEISLKGAKVLNQVDCKFIAAIMMKKYSMCETSSEYLVLFDQHAVHERIKLEQNITDYIIDNRWKSVPLDNVTLKLPKDEILYLHNYKEKFNQLGLQWTVVNKDEISLSSIPEAILGKNQREVHKVMKAVKNLIVEEISVIKLQQGCISFYPKSIMDLVFSEACRYAIKFGDKLSKNDCAALINDLSNCKTPFQCAHGRPVMAVILDIKSDARDYKVDTARLRPFKPNKKTDLDFCVMTG